MKFHKYYGLCYSTSKILQTDGPVWLPFMFHQSRGMVKLLPETLKTKYAPHRAGEEMSCLLRSHRDKSQLNKWHRLYTPVSPRAEIRGQGKRLLLPRRGRSCEKENTHGLSAQKYLRILQTTVWMKSRNLNVSCSPLHQKGTIPL